MNLYQSENNNWYFLTLAQHYGLPTRLLDWTSDPLIALWFAFNEEREYPPNNQYRVVWGIAFEKKSSFDYPNQDISKFDGIEVFEAPKIDQRIINQKAWFSVQSVGYRTFHEHINNILPDVRPSFTAINEILSHDYDFVKMKINDTVINRMKILEELNKKGINYHFLFPDQITEICKIIQHEVIPIKEHDQSINVSFGK